MSVFLVVGLVTAAAFVLTAVLTQLVRGAALGAGLVRQARTDRWHRRPTPAIGGIAIYAGFGVALGIGLLLGAGQIDPLAARGERALLPWSVRDGLLAAGTVVFLVGLVDDLVALKPLQKLAGQVAAAALLVLSGVGVWATGSYVFDVVLSLAWFVAISNAMNLLDNMDGLAAGTAAIAGGTLSVLFFLEGEYGLLVLSLAFVGSVLGFLLHNYPPARIFMGDSGSLFLGLFLAGLSLSPTAGLSRSLFAVVAVPALILAIPILDTTLVTVGRVLEGRPISQGGKDHTSHRLVALGASEERTVWVLWTLALVGGAVGLMLRSTERATAYLLGGVLLTGLALIGGYLLSVRFRAMRSEEVARVPLYRMLVTMNERFPVLPFLLDGVLVGLSYYGAYLIRWDPAELGAELRYFESSVLVVVSTKLIAFVLTGTYGPRWQQFGLDDVLRVVRANLLGSVAAVAALLLLDRVGLSRGVVIIDFLVCSLLTAGSRTTFRLFEAATGRWSRDGTPVVVLGPMDEADLAVRQLRRLKEPRLRPAAVADLGFPRLRSRMGAFPLFGGSKALENALRESGATAVLVVGSPEGGEGDAVARYLQTEGAVDVFRLRVAVEPEGDRVTPGRGPDTPA